MISIVAVIKKIPTAIVLVDFDIVLPLYSYLALILDREKNI
jgi:hypothetical protein